MYAIKRCTSLFNPKAATRSPVVLPSLFKRQNSYKGIISEDYIVRSPYPEVDIPQTNLFSHVYGNFSKFSRRTALIDAVKDQEITYEELNDKTSRASSALRRMGFGKGEVLMICSPNTSNYAVMFFAAMAAGGVVSTCNPTYTPNELSYQIMNSGTKIVATVPELLPTVKEAIKGLSTVEKIIVMDESVNVKEDGMVSMSTLVEDGGSLFEVAKVDSKSDIAVLPYSSGTTGLPKGVMLSHYNVVANICQMQHPELAKWSTEDVVLSLLPFFHIYGMVVILFNALQQGAMQVLLPKFEPESFLSTIQKYKVTIANLVPPLILFLSKHPLVDKYNVSSIKTITSGAAPLGGDLVKEVQSRTGIEVVRQGYGLTETSPVSHMMPISLGMQKPSSIGPTLPNQLAKVVDIDTGGALGPNREGEIVLAGPNIMLGYLNLPEATKDSITNDGWFHTGDIGCYDDDGHFYITDRLKELIKVKGLQVAPAELEALLQSHPQIADAAVIGVPDERLGEAPKGYVVRREGGGDLTEEEVMEYVKENLAEHKWLVGGVEFVEAVPKSASGKILRRNLRNAN